MAKKNDTVDETIYVKTLVEAGMNEDDAAKKVSKLVTKVNELMDGESIDAINNIIAIKVRELIAASKSDKFTVTVVAAGQLRDTNFGSRYSAVETYNEAPSRALETGAVKIVKEGTKNALKAKDGNWLLAFDTREFWDDAKTKQNYGYNKPFKTIMSRDIIGIIDGEITKLSGNVDVVAGSVYDMYGTKSEKSGVIYLNDTPKPRLVDTKGDAEFYNEVYKAAAKSDMATDVEGALDEEIKGTVLVKGFVHSVGTTSIGGQMMSVNNEVGSGFTAFAISDDAVDAFKDATVGTDVIVVGYFKKAKDPRYTKSLQCYNAVVNPNVGAVGKTLEDLKDFEF